ncbi:MAG: diguanylate cyclase [Myxococcaceae bacterium]
MNPSDLLGALKRTVEQLAAFNEIAKALTSTLEVREVLQLVMAKVSEMLRPTNWSLLLLDEKTGQLYFEIVVGVGADRLRQMKIAPGEGIAGRVFQSGQPVRVDDVSKDPSFSPRFDQATDFVTASVIAVPLQCRGRVLGVMELVNGPGLPQFTTEDLQAVIAIADYAAIAIENARNFSRVQELTITDEHTGLFNSRHLRALLPAEVERSKRFNHPVSLLFIDLDRFKQVNDTYGHLVGSALLAEVGELLRSCIRGVDYAFRYGGDEFAMLLIETDSGGAKAVGERVRDAFRGHSFLKPHGHELKLTASIGVATYPQDGEEAEDLIRAADQAMYRVKNAGRDGVQSAT